MNKTRLAALMLCGLAAPVLAQSNADSHLRVTLEAMNDGPEVAGSVVTYVKDKGVKFEFATQDVSSRLAFSGPKGAIIRLSSDLPDQPKILGPLIAREVSRLMYADMPDSAEKEYMRLSTQVRTWLELGGDKSALPLIGGYKAEALSEEFKIWLNNGSEAALEKVGKASQTKILPVLIDDFRQYMRAARFTPEGYKRAQDKLAALEAGNKNFVNFLLAENEWRRTNAHLLK